VAEEMMGSGQELQGACAAEMIDGGSKEKVRESRLWTAEGCGELKMKEVGPWLLEEFQRDTRP
jgi:hypothetical protein